MSSQSTALPNGMFEKTKPRDTIRAHAIFFDVDGVLLDSLPQHLQICADLSERYGLGLEIPTVSEFRMLIEKGGKISPMIEFFRAVGFPEDLAQKATKYYDENFGAEYPSAQFSGAEEVIKTLHDQGVSLGLVTANVKENVEPALGDILHYFPADLRFYFNPEHPAITKLEKLSEGARQLKLDPCECAYVGDQPSDLNAAREANFQFLAVSYGWGFLQAPEGVPIASTVREIADFIHPVTDD